MYNPSNIECSVCNSTNRTSYVTYNGSSVPLCRRHKEQIRLHGRITDINDYVMHDDYAEVIIRNLRDEEILKTKIDTEDVGKVKQHRWILIHHG
jgi:hypothetical protein